MWRGGHGGVRKKEKEREKYPAKKAVCVAPKREKTKNQEDSKGGTRQHSGEKENFSETRGNIEENEKTSETREGRRESLHYGYTI